MAKFSPEDWAQIRADWEIGQSQGALAKKYGLSRQAIQQMSAKQGWRRDFELEIRRATSARISDTGAARDPEKVAAAIDAEADRRASVVKRHREETNHVRERLYAGLVAHRKASTKDEKVLAFEDLKAAKISSETLVNVHALERRAFRLDSEIAVGAKSEFESMTDAELDERLKRLAGDNDDSGGVGRGAGAQAGTGAAARGKAATRRTNEPDRVH